MEDWGATASAPMFTLFRKISPEEAAQQEQFVDIIVYNRWSKAERRQYQRLKAEQISRHVREQRIKTMDELSSALESLNFMKSDTSTEPDPFVDDLIERLSKMKCSNTSNNDMDDKDVKSNRI